MGAGACRNRWQRWQAVLTSTTPVSRLTEASSTPGCLRSADSTAGQRGGDNEGCG